MLDAPIRRHGLVIGVLRMEHVGPARTWTTEEQTFAASLAAMATLTLEAVDRRLAQEALEHHVRERTEDVRRMTAHLQIIIEESPLAMIELDQVGRVTTWNAADDPRFRRGDGPGHPVTHFRTLLYDQGRRQGHRPGPGDGVRDRQTKSGLHLRRQYPGQRHDLRPALSVDRNARSHPRTGPGFSTPQRLGDNPADRRPAGRPLLLINVLSKYGYRLLQVSNGPTFVCSLCPGMPRGRSCLRFSPSPAPASFRNRSCPPSWPRSYATCSIPPRKPTPPARQRDVTGIS